MRPRTTWIRKVAAVAVVVAAGSAGAVAVGATADANGGEAPTPRAGAQSPSESVFVPITPCRIVNTQNPAGKIQANQTRQYRMHGNTSAQGGAAACGIPQTASALELTVTSVSADGRGYLRVAPAGAAIPNATFLNYGPGQNLGNTGTVAVQPGGGNNFQVRAFQARTHVVIDVNGYYVRGLHAVVNGGNGSLARGNGVVASVRAGTGTYAVTFDRNVSGCAYSATIGNPVDGTPPTGQITATPLNSNANAVYVTTHLSDGTLSDRPFHLAVTC